MSSRSSDLIISVAPAVQLDEPTVRRLSIARQMLTESESRLASDLSVDRMRAVLSADQAVELLSNTLLTATPTAISAKDREYLPGVLRRLGVAYPILASDLLAVLRLHELRNGVQHNGLIPSREDTRELVEAAGKFMRASVEAILNRDLSSISLVTLINDQASRTHLAAAEDALGVDDFKTCISKSAVAVSVFLRNRLTTKLGKNSWSEEMASGLERAWENAINRAAQSANDPKIFDFAHWLTWNLKTGFTDQLKEVLRPIELAQEGISFMDQAEFLAVRPFVVWTLSSREEPLVHEAPDWNPGQQDALVAFDFACRTLLTLQARDRPLALW